VVRPFLRLKFAKISLIFLIAIGIFLSLLIITISVLLYDIGKFRQGDAIYQTILYDARMAYLNHRKFAGGETPKDGFLRGKYKGICKIIHVDKEAMRCPNFIFSEDLENGAEIDGYFKCEPVKLVGRYDDKEGAKLYSKLDLNGFHRMMNKNWRGEQFSSATAGLIPHEVEGKIHYADYIITPVATCNSIFVYNMKE
jgi:hypothetical protein